MSIRDLKTFLAAIESGSFAGAALIVRRTQSAVTVQMKTLEDELGFALFDRSKRPPVLSDAGRAFAVKAADAVEACSSSDNLRLIRHFEKGGSGSSGLEFKRPAVGAASGGLRWWPA